MTRTIIVTVTIAVVILSTSITNSLVTSSVELFS